MEFDAALDTVEQITTGIEVAAAEPAYGDFPPAEHGLRYARLRALMEADELDVLVLTSEESVRYLSGYDSFIWIAASRWLPGALVVPRDPAAARLVISIFDAGAAAGTAWVELDPYTNPRDLPGKVLEHVRAAAGPGARVGFETGIGSYSQLPVVLVQELLGMLSPAADAAELLSVVRMLKSPAEIERLRTSAQAAVRGYAAGLESARAGTSEAELLNRIGEVMMASGATPSTKPLFLNAVAGADRHTLADAPGSERPLRSGDTVFVDGGGPHRGYMSDIIRIGAVGELDEPRERWMEAAVAANAAMRAAARPGITASELYETGFASYREAGLAEFAGSLFGHGIGLEIWERPFLSRHDDDPREEIRLRPGMTMCVEPMLVPVADGAVQGLFVVEDMLAITQTGADVLSDGLDRGFWRIPA